MGVIYPFVPSVDQPLFQCLRAKKRNLMAHLFNKYLLSIYCVMDSALGSRDSEEKMCLVGSDRGSERIIMRLFNQRRK